MLIARRENRLKNLAQHLEKKYHVQTRVIAGDLADYRFMLEILEVTKELDVGLLVNNAGYSRTGELLGGGLEDERRLFQVNCEAPFVLGMEFGKRMVKNGKGGIIFV